MRREFLTFAVFILLSGCSWLTRPSSRVEVENTYRVVEDPTVILPKVAYFGSFSFPRDRRFMIPLINQLFQDIGSKKYSKIDREEILKNFGGRISVNFSDDGSFVFTADSTAAGFETVNDLLVSLVVSPDFDEEVISMKKGVVCENLRRLRDKPFQLAFVTVRDFLAPEIRPQLDCGLVMAQTKDTVNDFYRNLTLRTVKAVATVRSKSISSGLNSLKAKGILAETQAAYRPELANRITLVWVKAPFSNHTTVWAVRSDSLRSNKRYKLRFASRVIGEDFDSPIFKSIRTEQGLAYVVDGGWSADFQRGFFYFAVQHQPDQLQKVLANLISFVKEPTSSQIDDKTVQRNKIREKRRIIFEKESVFQSAVYDSLRAVFGVPPNDDQKYLRYVDQLDTEEFKLDLQNLVSQFTEKNSVIVVVGETDPIEAVQAALKDAVKDPQEVSVIKASFDENFKLLY